MCVVSTEKAAVRIHIDLGYKVPELFARIQRLVAMPLQIAPHPIQTPFIGGAHELQLCGRGFYNFVRISPIRPPLVYLNIVTFDEPARGRFLRFVARSGHAQGPWASTAEFEVLVK